MTKTTRQIECICRASNIIDDTYDIILCNIKRGISEVEVANIIERSVLELGGSGVSFDTIVAFGESGSEPHHVPTDKKLDLGMLVTIDMGAIFDGFCSDFTRTFAFGEVSEEQKTIYEITYKSQKLALAGVVAGAKCQDVDKIARDYISERGYGEFYIHGTGHGVGTLVHEPPTLNSKSEEVLERNTIVTIEPGIYLPNKMGVRIEDMIVVGADLPMSRHATELIILK